MDPISRRAVWDVIQETKLGRAVVLTTHRYGRRLLLLLLLLLLLYLTKQCLMVAVAVPAAHTLKIIM
jgi:hypothetical protein